MTQPLDMYTAALRIFGSLSIVLLIVFGVFYLVKYFAKRDIAGLKGKMIQVLATQYLGGKKNITIFKIPSAILVVGITNDSINLLARFKEEDFPNLSSTVEIEKHKSRFSALFNKETKNLKHGNLHE